MTDHAETSLPYLAFTASVPGDVPALGRLVVDEDDGDSQAWVVAALRSRYYSADADCALFYQAESRTPLGGSAATASSGYSGTASGSGSNVVDVDNLALSWEAVLSTQAASAGSHLQHTGSYRVFARVQADGSNTGTVGVCFEWAPGDFRNPQRNDATYLTSSRLEDGTAVEDQWILADLGVVVVPESVKGTQYWEGRLLAKSTVLSDQLFIDYLLLLPVDEFYAEAGASTVSSAADSYTAYDDFSSGTYAGDLASDTLPTGGTWGTTASPYEADDFAVSGGYAARTAVSDAGTDVRYGRIMYPSGTSGMTSTTAYLSWPHVSSSLLVRGLAFRIVDKDNFAAVALSANSVVSVIKVVGGTTRFIQSMSVAESAVGQFESLEITVDPGGNFWGMFRGANGTTQQAFAGQHSDLATGGTLAAGSCGIIDWYASASALTRNYDLFYCFVPVLDAAVFASQSIEFRHDGILREDSGGTVWKPASKTIGDLLLLPPAGREARTCEVIVKACRNDPRTGSDSAIDDISAKLYATPRYLTLPT